MASEGGHYVNFFWGEVKWFVLWNRLLAILAGGYFSQKVVLEDEQAGHFHLDSMHLWDGSDSNGLKTGRSVLNGSKDENSILNGLKDKKSNSKENGSDTSSSRQKEPKANFHLKLHLKRNLTRLIPFKNKKKINRNMRMKQYYCWMSPRPIMTTFVPMAILLVTSLGLSCLPLSDMVGNN